MLFFLEKKFYSTIKTLMKVVKGSKLNSEHIQSFNFFFLSSIKLLLKVSYFNIFKIQ
jgi:hypothetical protein